MELNFHLKGIFNASGNVEKAIDDIERFIEDANQGLLVRGAPEGRGAKVVDWHISNDEIFFEIRSDRYVRAHDAFIRLYNPLREILGKSYHIGLRGMQAKDYEIEVDLEGADLKKIEDLLSDVPEVKKIEIGEGLKIIFNELSEGDLRSHSVDKIIKLIQGEEKEELVYTVSKVRPGTRLYECKSKKNLSLDQDATELAEELGWVKRFPGKGQWTYLPPYAKLFRTISDVAVEEIPERLGFSEVLFPKLIPLEVMKKMRYLEGLPEGMYYVSPPKRDPKIFERFKRELAIRRDIPIDTLKEGLKDPAYVLAPAQCEPFYQFFSHEMVDMTELPIKVFDRSGFTYRWEGGAAKGLDRVNEFQRLEMVFIGTIEEVKETAQECLNAYMRVLDLMEFNWYVEVGDDPFYLEGLKEEKRDIEYPDIPKYEVRVESKGGSISVGSVNIHGTHFVQGFSIQSPSRTVWTGCVGLGLSRWVAAFLTHHGFDLKDWPPVIKERIKELPKVPKTLEWPKKR